MVCYNKVRQLFYYKVRQVLLQSATGITKCYNFITKCDRYYKVLQFYYKVRQVLQSATIVTKCDSTYAPAITEQKKCWELLAEKFDRFQTLRNNMQQHPITCNKVCKRTQHVTSNNFGSCWPTILRPFAPDLTRHVYEFE